MALFGIIQKLVILVLVYTVCFLILLLETMNVMSL
jgi:hypothetical protein